MQTSKCPVCQSDIIVDDEAFEGDLVDCTNCDTQLEIISLRPVQLSAVNNEEDDWNDNPENDDENDNY